MTRTPLACAAAVALATLAATGCGKAAPSSNDSGASNGSSATEALSPTTKAPSGDAGPITWATYREINTLDPVQAFDYPENTIDTALCDSLMRQQPDGTIGPGLAEKLDHSDPFKIVLTLRDGPTFWNGKPVTAEDVVFSLQRAASTKSGSFYPAVFSRVKSIAASGDREVTLTLSKPDYWVDGELSQMPGIVVEKAFAEAKGKKFGSPGAGTMCSGPFKLGDWKPGNELVAVRNDDYWDTELKAKVSEIHFKGVPDDSSLTSGLLTGAIDGTYPGPLTTYDQLKASKELTVSSGPSFATDAFVVSSLKGALADVKARQALSMALDRQGYISTVYHGQAQLPRTLANPGTWGYGKDVFQADWDKLGDPAHDVTKAKQMLQDAGAAGKTLTIGMSSEISNINSAANAIREAAKAIGLKPRFKAVSAQNYINFFIDPKAREGVDGFLTLNYPDYADPAAFYQTFVMPDGSQNYSGFKDTEITDALERARGEADPTERAKAVAEAGDRMTEQLPWIPLAQLNSLLITSKDITGAPSSFVYMGGPWANRIGAS
jgi:peptide/nickel transport system substrate-binding protein